MSAAVLKAQGNSHFAKKEWESAIESYSQALEAEKDLVASAALLSNRSAAYVHLDKLEEALADARLCINRKPTWSKGYARLGEVYSRQQIFQSAIGQYENAIRYAEDPAARARYTVALKTAKQTNDRNKQTYQRSSGRGIVTDPSKIWVTRLNAALAEGYDYQVGGYLELLSYAHQQGAEGWLELDRTVTKEEIARMSQRPRNIVPGTAIVQDLSECLLLDSKAFIIPPSSDSTLPMLRKLMASQERDLKYSVLAMFYHPSRWTPKEIIAELDKRLPEETWNLVRRACSVLARGNVLNAFGHGVDKSYGNAIHDLSFAIDLLEEGNRVWKDVSYDDKGQSFRPTMIRLMKTYLLDFQLEAARDAVSESAKKQFTLEAVEATARKIIAENPQSEWPTQRDCTRLGYQVLPTARAYLSLAFASAQRAGKPLIENTIPAGKAAVTDLPNARKAARYYDLVVKLLPEDDPRRSAVIYMALQQHLRAGGQKISDVIKRADEAEKSRIELSRFFEDLEEPYQPRTFVRMQIDSLREWLATSGARAYQGVEPIDQIIKPIPTLNMQGVPASFDPNTVLDAAFWLKLEGDVGIVDVLAPKRDMRGTYA
ncbi:hypothetical protein JCM5353_003785 [Sporobolomyces roseus]